MLLQFENSSRFRIPASILNGYVEKYLGRHRWNFCTVAQQYPPMAVEYIVRGDWCERPRTVQEVLDTLCACACLPAGHYTIYTVEASDYAATQDAIEAEIKDATIRAASIASQGAA